MSGSGKKVLEMVRPLLCDFVHNVVCLNNVCSKVKLTIIGTRLARRMTGAGWRNVSYDLSSTLLGASYGQVMGYLFDSKNVTLI